MRTRFGILLIVGLLCESAFAGDLRRADIAAAARYSTARRGLELLVIQHENVLFHEVENGAARGEPHKIYSGTKSFWVLAALAAAEDGILKMDERAAETLPEWREDAAKSRLTIRELLSFTSGLDAEFHLHSDLPDRNSVALRVPIVGEAGRSFIYGPAALQVFGEIFKRKLAARGTTPVGWLEKKVMKPLGLGTQIYKLDGAGNPLLASGFQMTAEQWSRMGRLILRGGSPVVAEGSLAQCFWGTGANPAFGIGFWNNRTAGSAGAREFDIEEMLEKKWAQQDWRRACICRAAPADLVAAVGSGYQRLFVIPSMELIIVRQGTDARFSDGEFLRLLLGR